MLLTEPNNHTYENLLWTESIDSIIDLVDSQIITRTIYGYGLVMGRNYWSTAILRSTSSVDSTGRDLGFALVYLVDTIFYCLIYIHIGLPGLQKIENM